MTVSTIDPLTHATEWKVKRATEFMRCFGLNETEEEMLRALESIEVDDSDDDDSQWSSPVHTAFQDPFVSDDSDSGDDEVSDAFEPVAQAPDDWAETGLWISF